MNFKKWLSFMLSAVILAAPVGASAAIPIMPEMKTPEDLEQYLEKYIIENFKDEVSEEKLNEAKLKGMFDALDNYSNYYTKDEYKSLVEGLSGTFVGIGVHIEESDKYIRVTKPVAGSPAEKAGIQIGDVIYKVDGKDIGGMSLDAAAKLIRGEENTIVKITVWKASTKKEVTYTLKRALVTVETVTSKMLPNNVGYVSLSEFSADSATQVIQAIESLKGAKSIVFDLRDNPGGYLSQAIAISDFFLPKGSEIMSIDYKASDDQVIKDELNGYTLPVVVLVNKNSASASEIVAAALQKNGRAKIVGENSYGKGTVQDVITLPSGDGFKLTVAEYKGPQMMKINGVGVKPDVEVKLNDPLAADVFKALSPMLETKTYKAGEAGLNVYGAQQRLNIIQKANLKLTATMDTMTVNAIKTYQKANKLSQNGLLDSFTKKSLEEKSQQLYNRITSDTQLEKALELLKTQ